MFFTGNRRSPMTPCWEQITCTPDNHTGYFGGFWWKDLSKQNNHFWDYHSTRVAPEYSIHSANVKNTKSSGKTQSLNFS